MTSAPSGTYSNAGFSQRVFIIGLLLARRRALDYGGLAPGSPHIGPMARRFESRSAQARGKHDVMPSAWRLGALIIALIAVVVAAILGYPHRSRIASAWRYHMLGQSDVQLAIGKPFPALDLVSPLGNRMRYLPAPGKVTFVNVFATWCPPCRAESPAYALFAKSAASRGIEITGIDRAETAQKIEAYRREYGLTFPYLIDDGGTAKDVLGARAMPVTIVVDARGIVRADIAGPVTTEQLNALTEQAEQPL